MSRTCDYCGKPITFGCMTDDYGDKYIHEECFDAYMDKTYGKGKWTCDPHGPDDGPYYQIEYAPGKWEGIGIYYTEYEEENADEE